MVSWAKFCAVVAMCGMTMIACTSANSDAEGEVQESEDALLELPVDPVTEREVTAFPLAAFDPGQTAELASGPQTLAIGEDYPDALTIVPAFTLGCHLVTGGISIDSVASDDAAIEVAGGEEDLTIRAVSPGEATVSVTGTMRFGEEDLECWPESQNLSELPFEWTFDVVATRVAGAKLQSCDGSQHIAMEPGALIDAMILPTNAQGEAFEPSNAAYGRAVRIRIEGDVDSLEIAESDTPSLAGVFLPSTETTLYLHTPHAAPIRIDAVSPEQVTEVNARFIAVVDIYEDPLVLEDGTEYGTQLSGAQDRLFPLVSIPSKVGQISYCSPLDEERFTFETTPPEVCEAESLEWTSYTPFKFLGFGQEYLGHAAHVKADGLCSMRLSADSLNGGAGWSVALEATISGTDTFETMALVEQ